MLIYLMLWDLTLRLNFNLKFVKTQLNLFLNFFEKIL